MDEVSSPQPKTEHSNSEIINHHTNGDPDPVECTSPHEGKELLNETYPIQIDKLFSMLFMSSNFYLDLHATRKSSDLTHTAWTLDPSDNSKKRVVTLTVSLGQIIGPKTSQVTEEYTMLPCSKPGNLYAIDIMTTNQGIPYANNFFVPIHYCLKKVSDTETSIHVTGQVIFKKSTLGFAKAMIERNAWMGLNDYFTHLNTALQAEGKTKEPQEIRLRRRKRRASAVPPFRLKKQPRKKPLSSEGGFFATRIGITLLFLVFLFLMVLNVVLYCKLRELNSVDLEVQLNSPKSANEWIQIMQERSLEAETMQETLRHAISHLMQVEETLMEIKKGNKPNHLEKLIDSIVQTN